MARIRWHPSKKRAESAARLAKVMQIKGGKQLPVTDWIKATHITRFEEVKK